jgi:hypothetical protein
MHLIVQHITGTQDFELKLTDQPGVVKNVGITAKVSSTELKYVVQALLQAVPPHPQDNPALQRWFNNIP